MSADKLWVDDLRDPPDGWLWAKTSTEAIEILDRLDIVLMSLDHDLGGEDTTRPIVLWLCENPMHWPKETRVHSMNPVGVDWLTSMIRYYGPGSGRDF